MSSATDSSYDFAAPAPVAATPPSGPPQDPPKPQPRIAESLCPQCGFRIVGKPRQNRCPECRAPLDSQTDLLQFTDARWIRRSSWAALAIGIAIVPHLIGACLVAFGRDALDGSALHVLGAILTLWGLWVLTRPEDPRHPKTSPLAITARWAAIASVILWIGAMATALQHGNEQWLMTPALLVMALEAVTYGLFASKLAQRIPHEGLTHQLRNFALLLPPFFGFLVFCVFNDLTAYSQIFFCSFPLMGGLAGMMLWITATQIRLFLELRNAASAADVLVQKHLQAAEAAARAAAKAAAAHKPAES